MPTLKNDLAEMAALRKQLWVHSHSIVPGGFEVMS